MKPGQGWLTWWLRCSVVLTSSLVGCAGLRPGMDKNLMADKGVNNRNVGVLENYTFACPDVVEITIARQPHFVAAIGPDGCVNLGNLGQPRIEGQTPAQAARQIASHLHLPRDQVQVRVAEFRSQYLFLFGEINGLQRSVPYQGQETVLDLLQRVGGLTAGAAPEDVYVIRSRIADGQRPEIFRVDLNAIVLKQDYRTNLRLQPFDQIHVGETPQGAAWRNTSLRGCGRCINFSQERGRSGRRKTPKEVPLPGNKRATLRTRLLLFQRRGLGIAALLRGNHKHLAHRGGFTDVEAFAVPLAQSRNAGQTGLGGRRGRCRCSGVLLRPPCGGMSQGTSPMKPGQPMSAPVSWGWSPATAPHGRPMRRTPEHRHRPRRAQASLPSIPRLGQRDCKRFNIREPSAMGKVFMIASQEGRYTQAAQLEQEQPGSQCHPLIPREGHLFRVSPSAPAAFQRKIDTPAAATEGCISPAHLRCLADMDLIERLQA